MNAHVQAVRWVVLLLLSVGVLFASAEEAKTPKIKEPLVAGAKQVTVQLSGTATKLSVKITHSNGRPVLTSEHPVGQDETEFILPLAKPLVDGDKVSAREFVNGRLGEPHEVTVKGFDPPTIEDLPLRQWEHFLRGSFSVLSPPGDVKVEVQIDGEEQKLHDSTVEPGKGKFVVFLKQALVEGQKVKVRLKLNDTTSQWSKEVKVEGPDAESCTAYIHDNRCDFEASIFLGVAVDTFASGETKKFLNPDASGDVQERGVGGFDFAYRLIGPPITLGKKHGRWQNQQLWLYGETVHGTRSSEINCKDEANKSFLTCTGELDAATDPLNQVIFIIRNATSLEGFAGLRWEFLSLRRGRSTPTSLYLKAQAGFITASKGPDDVADVHHVGLGVIATKGMFEGSYVEVGFGRTDLFSEKPKDRWKVDALVTKEIRKHLYFFAQIVVDADVGSGSDSIQSYLGLEYDLRGLKLF